MHAPPTHSYEPAAHACMHAHNVHIDRVSSALRWPLYPRPPAAPLCRWITFVEPLSLTQPVSLSVCCVVGLRECPVRLSRSPGAWLAASVRQLTLARGRREGPPHFSHPSLPSLPRPREWVLFLCCVCVCVCVYVFLRFIFCSWSLCLCILSVVSCFLH
jgi:hypothetical protein